MSEHSRAKPDEHPTPEKLRALAENRLAGDELIAALRHVRACDRCYDDLPDPSVEELRRSMLANDAPAADEAALPTDNGARRNAGRQRKTSWRERLRKLLSGSNKT